MPKNKKLTIYLILLIIPATLVCVLTVNYFILAWSEPSGSPPNGSATQDLNLNSHKIINLTDPVNNQDAATKSWVMTNAAGTNRMTICTSQASTYGISDYTTTCPTGWTYEANTAVINRIRNDYNLASTYGVCFNCTK